MIKNIFEINQHLTGNYSMKCFPRKLIYVKANVFLYLVEWNAVRINVFTLELCFKNYFCD